MNKIAIKNWEALIFRHEKPFRHLNFLKGKKRIERKNEKIEKEQKSSSF